MATNWLVLDVSKYQPVIDYKETAKAVQGVILRCGLTYWGQQNKEADPCFEKHYAGFKAAGVPVGVYYYSAADSVAQAKAEAAKCLEIIKGKKLEFPVYFDMENNERNKNLTASQRYEIASAFLSTVEAAGYFVGFYSYTSFINQMGKTYFDKLAAKYSIWLADYRTNYNRTLDRDMHQYTSSGSVKGISGRVDLNHCYRDFPAIIKKAGLNGYTKDESAETDQKPAQKRMQVIKIGPVTEGDAAKIKSLCDSLNITNMGLYSSEYAE